MKSKESRNVFPKKRMSMNNTTISESHFPCLESEKYSAIGHAGFGLLAMSYLMNKPLHLRVCLTLSNALLASWGVLTLRQACVTNLVWGSLFCAINAWYASVEYFDCFASPRTEDDDED